MIRDVLKKSIADISGVSEDRVTLEYPSERSHGDYATNIALILAKERGTTPRVCAENLVAQLSLKLPEEVSAVSVAGPGFINFTLSSAYMKSRLLEATLAEESWGKNDRYKEKRVMVEYTDPNVFKEMHVGHLMSNSIGEARSRLFEAGGAEVFRVTYQGDVGLHVAKALYGMERMEAEGVVFSPELIGKAYADGARAYEELEEAKKTIHEINRAVYNDAPEWRRLYGLGKQMSLEAFEEIYHVLGSEFDRNFFESESVPEGIRLIEEGIEKKVFEESDGAIVYHGEKHGLHTRVFKTSEGVPTYEGKELGLPSLKESVWPHDESVVITAQEQKEYFKVVLSALSELRPLSAKKITHIPHGFLRLPEGKMSSRTGNVFTARALIALSEEKAKEKNEDMMSARAVAVGAIKYAILKQKAGNDTVFNTAQALSLEGDSGPYLQYALVRAKSVLRNASLSHNEDIPSVSYEIEHLIHRFPEIVTRAQEAHAPHHITQFLTELAGAWNTFYAKEKIIGGAYEAHKLLIARAFVVTMENGLSLLAIPAPEKL